MKKHNIFNKKISMNNKGVFITLTALVLAGILIISATSINNVRLIEEDATTLAIASQRSNMILTTATDSIRSIYTNSGISWQINDKNFIYTETFPQTAQKAKILQNISKFKSFFYQEFPKNTQFYPENVDLGEIIVYGKDMNVKHSPTSGFGTNTDINFNLTSRKFTGLKFDVNVNAEVLTLKTETLPLCASCANPVDLSITIRNSAGSTIYSFYNTIDYAQSGNLDLNTTSSTTEVRLSYSQTRINWSTNTTSVELTSTFTFNDPLMDIGLNKSIIKITETSDFGVEG